MQELFEENAQLALLSKSTSHQNSTTDSDQLEDTETGSGDNSLSEQLTSNAQARASVWSWNRRLASTVESLQRPRSTRPISIYSTSKRTRRNCLYRFAVTRDNLLREKQRMERRMEELEVKAVSLDKLSTEIEVVMKEKSELANNWKKPTCRFQDYSNWSMSRGNWRVDQLLIRRRSPRCKDSVESGSAEGGEVAPGPGGGVKQRQRHDDQCPPAGRVGNSAVAGRLAQLAAHRPAACHSQLVAEKEEILNEHAKQTKDHQQLLVDQLTLQKLHEQLTGEYETLVKEREQLKAQQRDVRGEQRTLREQCDLVRAHTPSCSPRSTRSTPSRETLNNLRAEHSKLKEDFRNLFAASDKIKTDYRSVQEEYRALKLECGRHKLENTELQGELVQRNDVLTTQQVQISKITSQNE
ncbi:uncharacterized protein LOC111053908, partial [Nilaparvata lugens]|uniref:uncharacterized protein LOC111053908 n=1 Tax=Nilaparvata lugens TaxID=108931 RepID=UPI00193D1B64